MACAYPKLLRPLLLATVLVLAALPAAAQNLIDTVWHLRPLSLAVASDSLQGVQISGMPLPPAAEYDIPLADPAATVAKIKEALGRVLATSPVAAAGIARLAQHGTPRLVYDALFPEKQISRVVIAAFLVGEFTPQHGKRDFTVMIGRFGANWPADELAAVLVHELIGHGIQRLENRFGRDRPIDLECEARLWQQMYYIDSKAKLDTHEMVGFRNTTNRRICHDFRRYLAEVDPAGLRAWDGGRPDMSGLLKRFPGYYDIIRKGPASRP